VELALRYGMEGVWIGARTTANPFVMKEVTEAMRGCGLTVMVKNAPSPDVQLWIGAVERCRQVGLKDIVAVHRGFDVFMNGGYRNNPLWEVPIELRRLEPDLPILCDPSHIAGRSDLVAGVAHAAMLLDFDGLMVEVHPSPADALTDATQQLTPAQLRALLKKIGNTHRHNATDATGNVDLLRKKIDDVDRELLSVLANRMSLSRQIAEVKRSQQMSVYQPQRWEKVLRDRMKQAGDMGLDPAFVKEIFEKIHGESVRVQMEE
jgi:chorismate mutase